MHRPREDGFSQPVDTSKMLYCFCLGPDFKLAPADARLIWFAGGLAL
jgi:hypothetical protein